MEDVRRRVQDLAGTDAPAIPNGLVEALESDIEENALDNPVDNAAAPAVHIWDDQEIHADMDRRRPLILVSQRDSGS